MSIDDDTAFGDSLEEVKLREISFISKVKEPHIFEEKSVHAGLR